MIEIATLMQLTPFCGATCEIIYSYLHIIIIKHYNTFFYFDGTKLEKWANFNQTIPTLNVLIRLGQHILFIINDSSHMYALDVEKQFQKEIVPMKIVVPEEYKIAGSNTEILQRTDYIFETNVTTLGLGSYARYVTVRGNLYCVGFDNVHQLNFKTKKWDLLNVLFTPGLYCVILAWKEFIFAIGGSLPSGKSSPEEDLRASTYVLNTTTLTVERHAPMEKYVNYFSAVVFDDRIYVFGGHFINIQRAVSTREARCLDCHTGTWHRVADMPEPRTRHISARLGNYIYIFGGYGEDTRNTPKYYPNSTLRYCPNSNTWTTLTEIVFPRGIYTSILC